MKYKFYLRDTKSLRNFETFDNRFSSTGWAVPQSVRYRIFRLQASYLSATSDTGRQSCRVKSLYMKRFWEHHNYSWLYSPAEQWALHGTTPRAVSAQTIHIYNAKKIIICAQYVVSSKVVAKRGEVVWFI